MRYESQRDTILSQSQDPIGKSISLCFIVVVVLNCCCLGDDWPPGQRAFLQMEERRRLQAERKANDMEVDENEEKGDEEQPKKFKRTPSAISAAANKEKADYFSKKVAEFADVDDFDLASQSDKTKQQATSKRRGIEPNVATADIGVDDDDDEGMDVPVDEPRPTYGPIRCSVKFDYLVV